MLSRGTQNLIWVWHVQEKMGSAGTPRTVTPRGRSFLKVLSEQQHLQKELAAEKAAREAAEGRALISADEAAAAVGMLTVTFTPFPACLHAYDFNQATAHSISQPTLSPLLNACRQHFLPALLA